MGKESSTVPVSGIGRGTDISAGLVMALVLALGAGDVRQATPDEFLACVARVYERPVVPWYVWGSNVSRCPKTVQEVQDGLRELRMIAVEGPDAVWLAPDKAESRAFKSVELKREVRLWPSRPGQRALTAAERDLITPIIFQKTRPIPLHVEASASAPERAMASITLFLDVFSLRAKGPESVIGIIGEVNGTGRVAYGLLDKGRYLFKWDSPLLRTHTLQLGYQDVDRDGTAEILMAAWWSYRPIFWGLTVLDTQGRELTRQKECDIDVLFHYDEAVGVCPIVGTQVDLEKGQDGTQEIVVQDWIGVGLGGPETRFRLSGGRYVLVKPEK